jgi:hypothetical protein
MTVQPGTYNITLQRRADYSVSLQFKDSNDSAIDLSGWIVAAQAWNKARTTKYADFAVTYTNPLEGQISISLTDAQTEVLPDNMYYDVLLTDTTGIKEYYLEGTIQVSEGYTS